MGDYNLLGIKINTVSHPHLKSMLLTWLEGNDQHQIVTVNPEFVVRAQTDKAFKNILNEASLATVDGTGIVWALQLNNQAISLEERLTGVELTEILLKLAELREYKILFCLRSDGLTPLDKFSLIIKQKYPTLDFQVADSKEAVAKAQTFLPHIILVNLGAPEQEYWINENLPKITSARLAAGVGGTFDFLSGQAKRAPKFFRSFGLEWLWRLVQQPKRFKRIFKAVVIFPLLILKDKYNKNNE